MSIIFSTPSISELIAEMTLDEKLAQITSFWVHEIQDGRELSHEKAIKLMPHGIGQITRIGGDSTLEPAAAARFANQVQTYLVKETRLGIPAIVHEECCAGLMTLGSTIFPEMLGLAASWQPELAEKMTDIIRQQTRRVGAHQGLAPVLDVAREPRWGRVEETFGEDPLLVSHFGVAYVRGLQGQSLKDGVMATGKHFIGHSLSQGGLNCNPVRAGWNEIWNDLMLPFQAAITEANIASMMNAYPDLDGEVVAASRRVLTDILRGKLGFDGIIVSDYEAIPMLNFFHRQAETEAEAGVLSLNAGIDVELPTRRCYGDNLKTALEAGTLSLDVLDATVARILTKKAELGLFENPLVEENNVLEIFETSAQRQLSREIAEKTLTLLKNDGDLLPLPRTLSKIALLGPLADSARAHLGDYSYAAVTELSRLSPMPGVSFEAANFDQAHVDAHSPRVPSLLASIRAMEEAEVFYAPGCKLTDPDQSGFAAAVKAAEEADVVILALGDISGLTPDVTCGETRDSSTLRLPAVQEALLQAVAATGKPIVVVLLSGRVIALTEVAAQAAAILEAWIPGEEGGRAIAAALFGEFNPGGKLPITFPRSVGQIPVYYNHKPSAGRSNWYGPYLTEETSPLYPFGHGLSYTSFAYSGLTISRAQAEPGSDVEISLSVQNTGARAGEEVVQLYVCDKFASVPRPVKELKGYVRIALEPGESKTVKFTLPVNMLAFYDLDLNLVVEPGAADVMVGSSSEDIRLRGSFEISGVKTPIARRVFRCPTYV
ncbi:MAG TPA: beta-glucosidase [Anaerolineae bacterium]|jgi:beta-glucosidase|nr:beta-glucosidase [Anaerolineae bacterium]